MLSVEFIPTSSTDDEYDFSPSSKVISSASQSSASTSSSNTTTHPQTSQTSSSVNYSTNPEGLKFTPQAPIQFYYSLQKNSLRTVIDTLLTNSELGSLCTVFRVPCYGKWLKKRVAADMLVDHILTLKQAYKFQEFNELVDKINALKGKETLGRIPRLPIKINPIPLLKSSLSLVNKFRRPNFPVRLGSPLKEVTGLIFLDEATPHSPSSSSGAFTVDLYFSLPEMIGSERLRFVLCLYKASERIKSTSLVDKISSSPISPSLLDFTLNGSVLDQGGCRFRNHDSYDITLFCYKDRSNLLRILRHDTHIDLKHLVFEIVAINIAGSLSETLSSGAAKRPRIVQDNPEDVEFVRVSEKYLKETLQEDLKTIPWEESFQALQGSRDEDVEVLEKVCLLDLKCPLTRTKMRKPVKFKSCKHGQCFDLFNFQQITRNILNLRTISQTSSTTTSLSNRKKQNLPKLACPICNHLITEQDELVLDGVFKRALDTSENDDVAVEVDLNDASLKFIKEEEYNEDDSEEGMESSSTDNVKASTVNNSSDLLVINLTDEEEEEDHLGLLSFKVDKSKPIGSCPSRAITLD